MDRRLYQLAGQYRRRAEEFETAIEGIQAILRHLADDTLCRQARMSSWKRLLEQIAAIRDGRCTLGTMEKLAQRLTEEAITWGILNPVEVDKYDFEGELRRAMPDFARLSRQVIKVTRTIYLNTKAEIEVCQQEKQVEGDHRYGENPTCEGRDFHRELRDLKNLLHHLQVFYDGLVPAVIIHPALVDRPEAAVQN